MSISPITDPAQPTGRPAREGERNGVPVAKLAGMLAKVRDEPSLASFRFTVRNRWVDGTATTSTIHDWFGVGGDQLHTEEYSATSDHPTLGHGHGPTPHEYVLHALASCVAAGVVTTAAMREIELHEIDTVARGWMDVRGLLGVDRDIRNGFSDVQVDVRVLGDAGDADLDALVEASVRRSPVFDLLTSPTNVSVRRAGS